MRENRSEVQQMLEPFFTLYYGCTQVPSRYRGYIRSAILVAKTYLNRGFEKDENRSYKVRRISEELKLGVQRCHGGQAVCSDGVHCGQRGVETVRRWSQGCYNLSDLHLIIYI